MIPVVYKQTYISAADQWHQTQIDYVSSMTVYKNQFKTILNNDEAKPIS